LEILVFYSSYWTGLEWGSFCLRDLRSIHEYRISLFWLVVRCPVKTFTVTQVGPPSDGATSALGSCASSSWAYSCCLMNLPHIDLRNPVQGYSSAWFSWALVDSSFCNSMVIAVKGTLFCLDHRIIGMLRIGTSNTNMWVFTFNYKRVPSHGT